MTDAAVPPASAPGSHRPVPGPRPGPAADGAPQPADASTGLVEGVGSRLAALADLPVGEHADVYQLIHADLQAALAEVDGR